MTVTSTSEDSGARPGAVVRLVLAYDGEDVRLVSQRHLTMTLPAGGEPDVTGNTQGFWVEVRGADGTVLDRRAMPDPVRRDTEVFSDDPRRTLRRVQVDKPQGAFTIVVPDHPDADHVVLVASEPRQAISGPGEAAPGTGEAPGAPRRREIARFAFPRTDDERGTR